jgi:hypothetical protein
MSCERFRFVQDDSCHWYVIPADKKNAFIAWVVYMSDEGENYVPYEGEEFDNFRIDGGPSWYTFTDLQEDKYGM